MKARKKLLIALLSAVCLTAGACGLAACKDKKNPTDDPTPPDGGKYEVTATATDKNNNSHPVQGVWFTVGYVENYEFKNVTGADSKPLLAQTGEDGKAKFDFEPEEGKTYEVRLADSDAGLESRNMPYGYNATEISKAFTENSTTLVFPLEYLPNHYNYNLRTELNYKRVYDAATSSPKEEKSATVLTLEAGRPAYFYLNTYSEPTGSVTVAEASAAAAGVYQVSFTSSASGVSMYEITSTSTATMDADGIPAHGAAANPATLELTVADGVSRRPHYFYVQSAAAGEATITVTRTGDAVEPDALQTVKANLTAPTAKCADGTGTLSLMPTDGTLTAVKNTTDGYYHVGSQSGPLLYATLTKALSRVSDTPLKEMPDVVIDGGGTNANVFILPVLNANFVTTGYVDYTDVVAEYSKWVNTDGLYPVNDDLYAFLNAYGGNCFGAEPGKANWLLPCQFYAPAGGIDVTGSGTEHDPFILAETENRIDLTSFQGDTAYLKFAVNTDGAYSFVLGDENSGTLSAENGYTLNGKYYVAALMLDEIELQLTPGTNKVVSLTVAVESDTRGVKFIQAEEGGRDPYSEEIRPDKGLSENTAIDILPGISAYLIDTVTSSEGIWVKFRSLSNATYVVEVRGEHAQFTYNGHTYASGEICEIECTAFAENKLLISSVSDPDDDMSVNLLYISLKD